MISPYIRILKLNVGKLIKTLGLDFFFFKLKSILNWYLPWNFKEKQKIISFYSSFIGKDDLCFDIGANIGNITNYLLKVGAKVICVEPVKKCQDKLYYKFGKNKNIIIVGKALGEKEGTNQILISEGAESISTFSEKWINEGRFSGKFKWNSSEQVEMTTLDNLISKYGKPKFCKIDVEGYESEVIKGLSKPIPIICFEFTKEFLEDVEKNIEFLKTLGKVKFNFVIGASFNFYFKNLVDSNLILNTLKKMNNNHKLWGDIYVFFINMLKSNYNEK
ncbi:MAG: FkbM family methyltransferase [Promethearchaeota archaeon]